MEIASNTVVTLNYTLTADDKSVLDKSDDGSFVYLHGANNIIPGLEQALAGKTAGDAVTVRIPPEEAYGPRSDDRVQAVPREMFPADAEIEPDMQFQAEGPDGQAISVTVVGVEEDSITIDGNHPLAGVHLNFEVDIVEVRAATSEELEHGHVHGPGGHHDH